jgi:hypothetical protein
VVGHQDVGVNRKSVALTVMLNSLQVVKPVAIVAKDFLALIAPDNNVVKRLRILPAVSWPCGNITEGFSDKSILRPDPKSSS